MEFKEVWQILQSYLLYLEVSHCGELFSVSKDNDLNIYRNIVGICRFWTLILDANIEHKCFKSTKNVFAPYLRRESVRQVEGRY